MNISHLSFSMEGNVQTAVRVLDRMAKKAAKRGLMIKTGHEISLQRYQALPAKIQARFVSNLVKYEPIFDENIERADEFLDVSKEDEWGCLDMVKREYGVTFSDEVYNTIDKGDIIEIYDVEAIQIYRNLNFFKTTNYGLIDVISNPWMELWDRSSVIQDRLEKMVGRAMEGDNQYVKPCGVPSHILKERAFGMSQALITRPKFVAKVMANDGYPFGFLFTVEVEPIAQGQEAEKIAFV